MSDFEQTDVVVVGAGISGLSLAHYLNQLGLGVVVFERDRRAGGKIHTRRHGEFLMEHGPNSLLETNPHLSGLVSDLGIEEDKIYTREVAKNRYIARSGDLHPIPLNPLAFIGTSLFSARAKLRLLAEPFVGHGPDVDETLAAFVERRLGREFLNYAVDPFVAGVYAGIPEELSVASAFPKLVVLEEEYGGLIKGAVLGARKRNKQAGTSKQKARMFAFKEGVGTLVDALVSELDEILEVGVAVKEIAETDDDGYLVSLEDNDATWQIRSRWVVFTIPAHAYTDVNFRFDFPVGTSLQRIPYPPVSVVFFGYNQPPGGRKLDGFGFLVPRLENRRILGTIWNSSLFPGRAPELGAAFTTFVGGVRQPEVAFLDDSELSDLVRDELRDLLGVTAVPAEIQVARWDRAIPQYGIGHGELMKELEAFEELRPGLHLSGNFRNGVSAPDCIEQSYRLSRQISASSALDFD